MLKRVGMEKEARSSARSSRSCSSSAWRSPRRWPPSPKLLLLDEVAAGLTSTEIDVVLELVHQLHDEGITFIVVEHVMKVRHNLSHRIIVIDFGKQIAGARPTRS